MGHHDHPDPREFHAEEGRLSVTYAAVQSDQRADLPWACDRVGELVPSARESASAFVLPCERGLKYDADPDRGFFPGSSLTATGLEGMNHCEVDDCGPPKAALAGCLAGGSCVKL